MKKSRYTNSQILAILKQNEAGTSVADLCRKHGISDATFYNWRSKYDGMNASLMKRLKELEEENRRFKKMAICSGIVNLADEFIQGINASKYKSLAGGSKPTATRDLSDLLSKGCLVQLPGGRRSTRYHINLHDN